MALVNRPRAGAAPFAIATASAGAVGLASAESAAAAGVSITAAASAAAAGTAAAAATLPSAAATVAAAGAVAALPLSFLLVSSILPVVKVLIIAAVGLVTALPYFDVLHAQARKSLSKLVFVIFLPAIIFVSLGEAITPQRLLQWWFIPVNVITASVVGSALGILVAWATDCPPQYFRIVAVLTGIGNMGNMPLVLLSAVCSDSRNPFGGPDQCNKPGIAYIALGMWTAALVMWGVVYNVLAPPEEWLPGFMRSPWEGPPVDHKHMKEPMVNYTEPPDDFEDAVTEEEERQRQEFVAQCSYAQAPSDVAEPTSLPIVSALHPNTVLHPNTAPHPNTGSPLLGRRHSMGSDDLSVGHLLREHPDDWSVRQGYAVNRRTGVVKVLKKTVQKASVAVLVHAPNKIGDIMRILHVYDIFRPPVLAAFLAMVFGMVPALNFTFFNSNGPLRFLTDSLAVLGQAMIPCILLVLGANLVEGPGSSGLPARTTMAVVITRLVVVPIVGVCVVLSADRLGLLPENDKMFRFILLIQHAMPSSIQIGTACGLRGFGEREVAAVLFFEHICAVLSMGCCLFGFFYILYAD